MLVNLAPEERHYFDTHATLLFARKTKKVVNNITVNESCGWYNYFVKCIFSNLSYLIINKAIVFFCVDFQSVYC